MTLQRTSFLSIVLSALVLGLWGYFFALPGSQDKESSLALAQKKKEVSNPKNFRETEQKRKGVLKDIYLVQDKQRLHYKIKSGSSFLTLVPKSGRFDLYEKLENIDCWLQDKVYYDTKGQQLMQQIKHLQAKEGTYDYSSQAFLAGNAHLSLYRLSGNQLVIPKTSPFIQGIAEEVSFAVSGKNPEFQAKHFQALLGGQGEIK